MASVFFRAGVERADQHGAKCKRGDRATDRWRLAGRLIAAGLPCIQCRVVLHVVTYSSLVHVHHVSLSPTHIISTILL